MFSYIYMKILEGAPSGYDRLINRISRGHSSRVIELITSKFVEPGMKVLDIGCGTGTLAVSAAEKGAFVTGIDASAEMLTVARAASGAY
jgi:2-polyprenyl-3-methyl-5-hydroxy-6-metoxy-1,4-benzoquinol methylase